MTDWWLVQDSTRRPRFDLLQTQSCPNESGRVDISVVHLPHANNDESYDQIVSDVEGLGFVNPDKAYLVYYDGSISVGEEYGVCGQSNTVDVAWAYSIVYLQTCGMESDDATRAAIEGGFLGPATTLRFKVGYGIVDANGKLVRDTVPPGAVRNVRAAKAGKRVVISWPKGARPDRHPRRPDRRRGAHARGREDERGVDPARARPRQGRQRRRRGRSREQGPARHRPGLPLSARLLLASGGRK